MGSLVGRALLLVSWWRWSRINRCGGLVDGIDSFRGSTEGSASSFGPGFDQWDSPPAGPVDRGIKRAHCCMIYNFKNESSRFRDRRSGRTRGVPFPQWMDRHSNQGLSLLVPLPLIRILQIGRAFYAPTDGPIRLRFPFRGHFLLVRLYSIEKKQLPLLGAPAG